MVQLFSLPLPRDRIIIAYALVMWSQLLEILFVIAIPCVFGTLLALFGTLFYTCCAIITDGMRRPDEEDEEPMGYAVRALVLN